MNLYQIGAKIDSRSILDEIHVIVLSSSKELAENYIKSKYYVKNFIYSSKVSNRDYIVGSTFLDPEYDK